MKILLTKIRPPQRRKDILRRVRLIDTLHQNLHRKLTFVSAPAGYGKTTLLVDFADDLDAQVFWYLIGPDDNDFGQFVRHILASFQQKIPNFGEEIEKAFSTPGASPDPSSIAIDLINEIEERVDDFSVLVLDDYHLAGENEQIVDFIENLLEHLPDQLRILMGSRSVYGIPTANLYIRDQLITIGAEELRFRADELQRLVSQNYHVRLNQAQAEELARRADGWIVAIMLAVRSMENGALPKFSGAMDQVYDFLAQEVVQRQSEALRDFMLGTSVLDDFNPEICDYVLERNDSAAMLRSLEDRNLFVTRTETNEGPSYRYHQLFAEFLQHQLANQDAKLMAQLNSRAADWFRQQEQWELAVRHKLSAQDTEGAAAWMDEIAYQFYTSGRQSLLARWFETLDKSPETLHLAPHLLLCQAKTFNNQGEFANSERLLELAEKEFKKTKETEAIANTLVTRAMLRRFQGNYKDAVSIVEQAEQVLPKNSKDPSERHQAYQAKRVKGLANFYLGDQDQAVSLLSGAVDGFRDLLGGSNGAQEMRYLYDLVQTLSDLGLINISSGRILEAQKAFKEAIDILGKKRGDQGVMAIARNNIAYLYHQTGQYKKAWREYKLALENSKSNQRHRIQIGILSGKGDILRDLEEWDEARATYEEAIEVAQQKGTNQGQDAALAGLADIERASGNYSKAMNLLRESASVEGEVLSQMDFQILQGRIYLDMGRIELALEEFERALENPGHESQPDKNRALAKFYSAYALQQTGAEDAATTALEEALHMTAQLGYDAFLVAAARPFPDFLKQAQTRLKSPQLKSLMNGVRDFKSGKSTLEEKEKAITAPSLQLEIRGFGSGEVRRDGELISVSDWRSSRAKALFFYILDKQRVRKETIGLDFWPDFSASKVSSNFHATLWRVRQAIGNKDAILFEDDHYQLHPSIKYWYDVREFVSYIEQAESSELSEAGRNAILRQILDLYKGDYLEDLFLGWVDERRAELQEIYVRTLNLLADSERQAKQFREARRLYDSIIEVDPYQDQVHLAIMQCLVESGSPSAAKAHYKQYESLLRRELNAEPLPELQEYVRQLTS